MASRLSLWGTFLMGMIVLTALGAPWIAHYNPYEQNSQARLQAPSWEHWFGTDRFGRDLFARVLYGGRISLGVGLCALFFVVMIGLVIGLLAGYVGGWIDTLIMRLVDTLWAFPSITLGLVIVGLFGPGLTKILLAMVSVWWVKIARVVRGLVLQLKQEPYLEAAYALGLPPGKIIWRYLVPGVLGPVLPLATLELGYLILAMASLSFLGLGAQPPSPEWGAMLADGRAYFPAAPHLMIFPGFMIFVTVLALNLIGEGLRDILDPMLYFGEGKD